MRRLAVLCALVLAPAAGAAAEPPSWAQAQIATVVAHGLLAPDVASFRPDDPLTGQELDALVAGLTGRPAPVSADDSAVTIATLDARLVRALDLSGAASRFQAGARAAGLAPPSRLGAEEVVRLLGLRTDRDPLSPRPGDPATRAEAAFSAARILSFSGAQQDYARQAAATFSLPPLSQAQRQLLHAALSFVGLPYVWGGTSETVGFDCSGLVSRVYAGTELGRSSEQMAAAGRRIPLAALQPGDLVLFGAKGRSSTPAQVDHVGIYLGNGWFEQAGDTGVDLAPLTGWFRAHFAWGRRPLEQTTPSA